MAKQPDDGEFDAQKANSCGYTEGLTAELTASPVSAYKEADAQLRNMS